LAVSPKNIGGALCEKLGVKVDAAQGYCGAAKRSYSETGQGAIVGFAIAAGCLAHSMTMQSTRTRKQMKETTEAKEIMGSKNLDQPDSVHS
jgi:hypothetical protein